MKLIPDDEVVHTENPPQEEDEKGRGKKKRGGASIHPAEDQYCQ